MATENAGYPCLRAAGLPAAAGALLVLAGAVLAILPAWLPYGAVKRQVDAFALPRYAALFNEGYYDRVLSRSRLAGAALILCGGTLILLRGKIGLYLTGLPASFISFLKESGGLVAAALHEERKLHLFALLLLCALAVCMRINYLREPMRFDEAFTFTRYARLPYYLALSNYSAPNNQLFYTALVRTAYLLFGNEPWALRLPAMLAGVFMVPAAYVAIRLFYDSDSALLAGGLVAVSSILVEYSANARGYTLLCLMFLLLLGLAKYLAHSSNSFAWLVFVVLSALGFYTIPTMLYGFGTAVVWMLASSFAGGGTRAAAALFRRLCWASIAAAFVVAALYLPAVLGSGPSRLVANEFVAPYAWSEFVSRLPGSLGAVWTQWHRDFPPWFRLLLLAGFLTALALHGRMARRPFPVVIAAVLWCCAVLLLQRHVPPARAWLFLLPVYLGTAATGICFLLRQCAARAVGSVPSLAPALVVALSLMLGAMVSGSESIPGSEETGVLRDAEGIALFLKGNLERDDRVAACIPSTAPLEYYFQKRGLPPGCMNPGGAPGGRLFVVVNDVSGQTLEEVLERSGLAGMTSVRPSLLKVFPGSRLYLAEEYHGRR